MAFMAWNDRLMTGIEAIDRDHRRLVAMINELYDAIRGAEGQPELSGMLDRLVDYTRVHFAREERLFVTTGYPLAAQHKAEHDGMVAWVTDMQQRYEAGTATAPSLQLMNALKDWLFDHILGSDQRYVKHMMASGLLRRAG